MLKWSWKSKTQQSIGKNSLENLTHQGDEVEYTWLMPEGKGEELDQCKKMISLKKKTSWTEYAGN